MADRLRIRADVLRAALLLLLARLVVALVPFRFWRDRLGLTAPAAPGPQQRDRARRLARRLERAAARLPFRFKCLPRAMALSWMLRRAAIGNALVFAIRPPRQRDGDDALHAWVEVAGEIVIGDLSGPWHEVHRSGG